MDFRGDAKVTTWLYRITERVVRGRRRSDRIRRWLGRTRRADLERTVAPSVLTPIEELERRRSVEIVYRILERIPDKYRDVLVLFELEGASDEEIASTKLEFDLARVTDEFRYDGASATASTGRTTCTSRRRPDQSGSSMRQMPSSRTKNTSWSGP